MNVSIALLLVLLALPLHATATPLFDKGDAAKGQALHAKDCTGCHDTRVYSRANRKVKTPDQLAARISGCNINTGAGWFPEEELHVGAYLNQTFYKFK